MISVCTGVEESRWPDLSPVFTPRARRGAQGLPALPELQGLRGGKRVVTQRKIRMLLPRAQVQRETENYCTKKSR